MKQGTQGFSLLELVLALAAIGILIGIMIVPGRYLKESFTERAALDQIVSLLRISRQQALAESDTIKVYFAEDKMTFKKLLSSNKELVFKTAAIPDTLRLKKEVMVGFNAQGHPVQSGTITFLNKRGRERRITVAVGTGRITCY